ncbi:uncharacterized protein AMSG_07980 [Thecamonas trahens ATCC 50062]|uniref:Uncharacterized protein n=1 Tax=Thecamonas trahens ATCC 50062 TaxID=461836 RepID=A0A0L0DHU4_THETB|nr:hypothetical protein AMSG_07980 [Thecamonas trahens ATCC 50062]KNC51882.1 hypothetical protein AMSG_07980 [Thecamonas trahens ATCC 50062]|eukprot:XP_013755740.1 hypothetical protein AMSG_07980 [Thecamonas trahens ATCC 50062]
MSPAAFLSPEGSKYVEDKDVDSPLRAVWSPVVSRLASGPLTGVPYERVLETQLRVVAMHMRHGAYELGLDVLKTAVLALARVYSGPLALFSRLYDPVLDTARMFMAALISRSDPSLLTSLTTIVAHPIRVGAALSPDIGTKLVELFAQAGSDLSARTLPVSHPLAGVAEHMHWLAAEIAGSLRLHNAHVERLIAMGDAFVEKALALRAAGSIDPFTAGYQRATSMYNAAWRAAQSHSDAVAPTTLAAAAVSLARVPLLLLAHYSGDFQSTLDRARQLAYFNPHLVPGEQHISLATLVRMADRLANAGCHSHAQSILCFAVQYASLFEALLPQVLPLSDKLERTSQLLYARDPASVLAGKPELGLESYDESESSRAGEATSSEAGGSLDLAATAGLGSSSGRHFLPAEAQWVRNRRIVLALRVLLMTLSERTFGASPFGGPQAESGPGSVLPPFSVLDADEDMVRFVSMLVTQWALALPPSTITFSAVFHHFDTCTELHAALQPRGKAYMLHLYASGLDAFLAFRVRDAFNYFGASPEPFALITGSTLTSRELHPFSGLDSVFVVAHDSSATAYVTGLAQLLATELYNLGETRELTDVNLALLNGSDLDVEMAPGALSPSPADISSPGATFGLPLSLDKVDRTRAPSPAAFVFSQQSDRPGEVGSCPDANDAASSGSCSGSESESEADVALGGRDRARPNSAGSIAELVDAERTSPRSESVSRLSGLSRSLVREPSIGESGRRSRPRSADLTLASLSLGGGGHDVARGLLTFDDERPAGSSEPTTPRLEESANMAGLGQPESTAAEAAAVRLEASFVLHPVLLSGASGGADPSAVDLFEAYRAACEPCMAGALWCEWETGMRSPAGSLLAGFAYPRNSRYLRALAFSVNDLHAAVITPLLLFLPVSAYPVASSYEALGHLARTGAVSSRILGAVQSALGLAWDAAVSRGLKMSLADARISLTGHAGLTEDLVRVAFTVILPLYVLTSSHTAELPPGSGMEAAGSLAATLDEYCSIGVVLWAQITLHEGDAHLAMQQLLYLLQELEAAGTGGARLEAAVRTALSDCYLYRGRYREAESQYERAEQLLEGKLDPHRNITRTAAPHTALLRKIGVGRGDGGEWEPIRGGFVAPSAARRALGGLMDELSVHALDLGHLEPLVKEFFGMTRYHANHGWCQASVEASWMWLLGVERDRTGFASQLAAARAASDASTLGSVLSGVKEAAGRLLPSMMGWASVTPALSHILQLESEASSEVVQAIDSVVRALRFAQLEYLQANAPRKALRATVAAYAEAQRQKQAGRGGSVRDVGSSEVGLVRLLDLLFVELTGVETMRAPMAPASDHSSSLYQEVCFSELAALTIHIVNGSTVLSVAGKKLLFSAMSDALPFALRTRLVAQVCQLREFSELFSAWVDPESSQLRFAARTLGDIEAALMRHSRDTPFLRAGCLAALEAVAAGDAVTTSVVATLVDAMRRRPGDLRLQLFVLRFLVTLGAPEHIEAIDPSLLFSAMRIYPTNEELHLNALTVLSRASPAQLRSSLDPDVVVSSLAHHGESVDGLTKLALMAIGTATPPRAPIAWTRALFDKLTDALNAVMASAESSAMLGELGGMVTSVLEQVESAVQ